MNARSRRTLALMTTALLAGCAVGPNYVRPSVVTPPAFKEAEGWVRAQPDDSAPRGEWWTVLGDPVLNQLEAQVEVSNQNLAAAEPRSERWAEPVRPTVGNRAARCSVTLARAWR